MGEDFSRQKHIKFFRRCLDLIPRDHEKFDSTRLTLAFFAISGLDVLDALNIVYSSEEERQKIVDWVYSFQVLPDRDNPDVNLRLCGFRCTSSNGIPFNPSDPDRARAHAYDCSHIASTYVGLAMLVILGDDLSRINKQAIVAGLRAVQQPNGCFSTMAVDSESDMRFLYCASCICYMLDDWSGVDRNLMLQYIQRSRAYDGGFGQGPFQEGHGGSTFCAIASLHLMGKLHDVVTPRQLERLKQWCLFRQNTGYCGRPNKLTDTCYTFWIGSTLQLLGCLDLANWDAARGFVLSTQCPFVGGLGKWPDHHPDPLHTYFGLCGLSLMNEPSLQPIHSALNITQRAAHHLHSLLGKTNAADSS